MRLRAGPEPVVITISSADGKLGRLSHDSAVQRAIDAHKSGLPCMRPYCSRVTAASGAEEALR